MIPAPQTSQIIVIKYGGNAMPQQIDQAFVEVIGKLLVQGFQPIIVHGGGPQISRLLNALHMESTFIDGSRITTEESIPYICMALSQVGLSLVQLLHNAGITAINLNGLDAGLYSVEPISPELGLVGHITTVNTEFLDQLLNFAIVPVISSYGADSTGKIRNINADRVAGTIAGQVHAQKLYMLTNVDGLYADWPDQDSLIEHISVGELEKMQGSISTGMIPKVLACTEALAAGVQEAWLINGSHADTIYNAIIRFQHCGTKITS